MLDNLFTTDRFYLRPLVESDATNKYLSWLNNNKITFFLNSHYKKNSIESIVNYINKHNSIDSFHIGIFTKSAMNSPFYLMRPRQNTRWTQSAP